jgi:hypothetical protein
MPSRRGYQPCRCLLCIEAHGVKEDGTPIGGLILRARMNEHLALCEAAMTERRAKEAADKAYQASVSSSFFMATLRDENVLRIPTPSTGHASKTPDAEDFPSLSDVLDALPSLSPRGSESPVPPTQFPLTSNTKTAKREASRATLKAHLTFDTVDSLLSEACRDLNNVSSHAHAHVLPLAEEHIRQAQRRFEANLRSTPSLNQRRSELEGRFLHLEERLVSIRKTIPPAAQIRPQIYSTGMPISYTVLLWLIH